jgi:hypothetical protein
VSCKAYFSSCYFFITPFSFALQRWFLELKVALPEHLKSLKMKHRWPEDLKKWSMIR